MYAIIKEPYKQASTRKSSRTFKHICFLPTHKTQTKKSKELQCFLRTDDRNKKIIGTFGYSVQPNTISWILLVNINETDDSNSDSPLRKVEAEPDIDTSFLSKIERSERLATKKMLPILVKKLEIQDKEIQIRVYPV